VTTQTCFIIYLFYFQSEITSHLDLRRHRCHSYQNCDSRTISSRRIVFSTSFCHPRGSNFVRSSLSETYQVCRTPFELFEPATFRLSSGTLPAVRRTLFRRPGPDRLSGAIVTLHSSSSSSSERLRGSIDRYGPGTVNRRQWGVRNAAGTNRRSSSNVRSVAWLLACVVNDRGEIAGNSPIGRKWNGGGVFL